MIDKSLYTFLSIDLPPLLTAVLASLSCALLGNFLVLRRMSLMGDAISHSVLPGIVVAFIVANTRTGPEVFIGAAVAGVVTVVLIETIKRLGRIESDTAMGVIFSLLFALGILLMERASASSVDLDADCLLHGQLELIFWFPPDNWNELLTFKTLNMLPDQVGVAALVLILLGIAITVFYKELLISSFDTGLSDSLGFNSKWINIFLMTGVAGAVVASFEAVGSILVIAMIICPAATARLLTDNLKSQILLSLLFAWLSATIGYFSATHLPQILGFANAVSAAGMITVVSGAMFFVITLLAPKYGIVFKELRRFKLAVNVAREDILGLLFRLNEQNLMAVGIDDILDSIPHKSVAKSALRLAETRGEIITLENNLRLTDVGSEAAKSLVRRHRLWENFLVQKLGLSPDHVHDTAMNLEHFTTDTMTEELAEGQDFPNTDPHNKPIPE